MNNNMFRLEDVSSIPNSQILDMYSNHINPALLDIFKLLGFRDLDVSHAKGVVIEAEKFCHKNDLIDMQKLGPNRLQSVLAYNLSQLLPGELTVATLSVSGAEANEAAIKITMVGIETLNLFKIYLNII